MLEEFEYELVKCVSDVINFFTVRRQIGKHFILYHLVYKNKNRQDSVAKVQRKIIFHDLCPVETHQFEKNQEMPSLLHVS